MQLKIGMIFTLVCGLGLSTLSQNSLQRAIDAFATDPLMQNASISFMAFDMNKKETIAGYNAKMSLSPASTMKLVSTATALEILGAGHQFKTVLYHTGTIDENGTLNGHIVIKGGGDPALGSKYFEKHYLEQHFMQKWVAAIQNAGIKKINGYIIGDASLYSDNTMPAGWSWSDMGNYYGAAPSGLTVYDNMVRLYFKAGANAGDTTIIQRYVPYNPEFKIDNHVKAANVSGDNAYIYGAPYHGQYAGYGSIPKGKSDFEVKASMHDPAYFCAWELDSLLRKININSNKGASTYRRLRLTNALPSDLKPSKELTITTSPYLSSIVWWINMVSVNLFAEHMLCAVSAKRGGDGSVYSGATIAEKYWSSKGIDVTGLYVNDGSGLSRSNAISAKHFVDILTYMHGSNNSKTYLESLPVANASGTLRGWGAGTRAANNLTAKSGSMTRIKSHAGYVTTLSGRKVAFALIVNNYNATSAQLKTRIETIFSAMADYNQ